MFTMLLPMSMVLKSLSYLSSRRSTFFAERLPSASSVRSLILLAVEYAISVAEKNPDMSIITTTVTNIPI